MKNTLLTLAACFTMLVASAQEQKPMVRIAKLQIDAGQLDSYKAILKEEIEASISLEPGVLTLYAVADQKNPTSITIFETYASVEAYQLHLKSPQFIKYKTSTGKMVKSLELIPCDPVALGKK